jgi:hypothetical protein
VVLASVRRFKGAWRPFMKQQCCRRPQSGVLDCCVWPASRALRPPCDTKETGRDAPYTRVIHTQYVKRQH